MTDEKRNRLIAAVTVNVILLIAILAAVVVYQIIQIKIVSRNRNDIVNKIEQLQQETEKVQNSLDYWQSQDGLEDLAYEFGFAYGR